MRFLNIYDKAFGGDLGLRFAGARDSGDGSGALVFENFRIQNEQVLSDAARERVRRGDADQEIRSTDVVVDTTKSREAYLDWLAKTRPGPNPQGLRRPLWYARPLKPGAAAYLAD